MRINLVADLLAKLDSIPQDAKDKEREGKDKDKEGKDKDKDKDREKDKDKEKDKSEKDKFAVPASPRKQTPSSSRNNPPSPQKQYPRGTSSTASKKYPTNGSDFSDSGSQSGGSSPSGTLRRKFAISFDSKLLKTTKYVLATQYVIVIILTTLLRKWRRLAAQKTFQHTAEVFAIFPVVNQLMDLLHVDYKATYQQVFKAFKTDIKSHVYSPAVKGDSPLFNSLLKQIPEMMFSLVPTKYNHRLKVCGHGVDMTCQLINDRRIRHSNKCSWSSAPS